jgi:hypothetical protein
MASELTPYITGYTCIRICGKYSLCRWNPWFTHLCVILVDYAAVTIIILYIPFVPEMESNTALMSAELQMVFTLSPTENIRKVCKFPQILKKYFVLFHNLKVITSWNNGVIFLWGIHSLLRPMLDCVGLHMLQIEDYLIAKFSFIHRFVFFVYSSHISFFCSSNAASSLSLHLPLSCSKNVYQHL